MLSVSGVLGEWDLAACESLVADLWGGRLLSDKVLFPWKRGSDSNFIRLKK